MSTIFQSPAVASFLARLAAAPGPDARTAVVASAWGVLPPDDAQQVAEAAHRPTRPVRAEPLVPSSPFSTGKVQPKRHDHAASTIRRRRAFRSSPMPDALAVELTDHMVAVMGVIADWCREGPKALFNGAVATRAGVCVSTVQRAYRRAEALGLLRVQRRARRGLPHLPSIVTIISADWLDWLGNRVGMRRVLAAIAARSRRNERVSACPATMTPSISKAVEDAMREVVNTFASAIEHPKGQRGRERRWRYRP